MKYIIILFLYCVRLSWSCRPDGSWSVPEDYDKHHNKAPQYFSSNSWGGWIPPEGNDDWKLWIDIWGNYENADGPGSDDWGSERDPESGWPQNWNGYGPGISGVPPPPWAYVPESYDKPDYCFHRPVYGNCFDDITRWGFNPTYGKCQTFSYSGCGGNQNNFVSEARCVTACVEGDDPECEDDLTVNFEEMAEYDLKV